MSKRTAWITTFLTVTALAVAGELYAAFDSSTNTTPWTELIVRYIPAPITYTAIAVLVCWLPIHFVQNYRRKAATSREAIMTLPVPAPVPTQSRHPWRATARTVLAAGVALAPLLPTIAATAHVQTVPIVAGILVVAGAITRVLAIPAVDAALRRFVPWLATSPAPQA